MKIEQVPHKADFVFVRGDDFFADLILNLQGEPLDLRGMSFLMTARPAFGAPAVLSLSTSNGLVVKGNRLNINIPSNLTRGIAPKRLVYDVQLTTEAYINRTVLAGTIELKPGVTEP